MHDHVNTRRNLAYFEGPPVTKYVDYTVGDSVVLTGSGFGNTPTVMIGTTSLTTFTTVSDT